MILTLFATEWKRRFRNAGTMLCVAAIPLIFAVLLCPFNFLVASADLSYPLQFLILPTAGLLPLSVFFTTRKEKKGTNALMRSLPTSPVTRTLAAFLADLAMFGMAVAVIAVCPLLFKLIGTPDIGSAYTGIGGFALFGIYALSLSRATVALPLPTGARIALLFGLPALTVGADLLCNFLPLPALLCDVNELCNPVAITEGFLYGHFYLPGAVVLVCLSAALLVLACLCLFWGRFARTAPRSRVPQLAAVALALVLSLSLGVVGAFLPQKWTTLDVTVSDTFDISGRSRDFLGALDTDVTVYYLLHGGKRNADRDLDRFLSHYTAASERVRVEYVDTDEHPDFAAQYTDDTLSDHIFIVTAGERSIVIDRIDLHHYYNSYLNMHLTPVLYRYCLDAADYYIQYQEYGDYGENYILYGMMLYEYSQNTVAYFDGDANLTNAIRYVTSDDVSTVYLLGQTERSLRAKLVAKGYFFKDVTTLTALGKDCDLLLIAAPIRDITADEKGVLQSYLDEGGKLLLTTSYAFTNLPNLLSVLGGYGLGIAEKPDLVYQKPSSDAAYQSSFYAAVDKTVIDFDNADGKVTLLSPHTIQVTPVDGVTQNVWLKTTEDGSFLSLDEFDKEAEKLTDEQTAKLDSRKGEYACGVLAQKGDSRVLWISSAAAFSDVGHNTSKGANYEAFLGAMEQTAGHSYSPLSIAPVKMDMQTLTLNDTDAIAYSLLSMLILPPPILLPFILTFALRRAKRKK